MRSGIRWLCADGHLCRRGEVIAFCNISIAPRRTGDPFFDEKNDFQVAFSTRVGGRLRRSTAASRGGFLDQLHYGMPWRPDFVIGHIASEPDVDLPEPHPNGALRLLMLAGRRMVEFVEIRNGLMTGWHDRARGWWGDGDDAAFGTVISMGTCEQIGVVRGEQMAFLEMLEAASGPAQIIYQLDEPLVPCAAVAFEQLNRSEAALQAIAADVSRSLVAGAETPTSTDFLFAGSMLASLKRSMLTDRYDVLTRRGVRRTEAPDAVILSINSEPQVLLRHRRLGYALHCNRFRLAEMGLATRAWLKRAFEPVKYGLDDIRRDYARLLAVIPQKTVLVINSMLSSGRDQIHSYAAFDSPLSDTLVHVRAKGLNLLLHDLAREHDISIVDADAIAAEMGMVAHAPDGIHQSGPLQAELRREILRILRDRRVPGFAPA